MPELVDTIIQKVADALCTSLHLFPDEDGNTEKQDEYGYEIYKTGTSLYISDVVPNKFVEDMENVLKMKVTDLVLTKDTNKEFFDNGQRGFITEDFYKAVDDLIRNRIYEFNDFFSRSSSVIEMSNSDLSLVTDYLKRTLNIANIAELSEAIDRLINSYSLVMSIGRMLGIDKKGHAKEGFLGTIKHMQNMASAKLKNPEAPIFSSSKEYDTTEDEKRFFEEVKEIEFMAKKLDEVSCMILSGDFAREQVHISGSASSYGEIDGADLKIRKEFNKVYMTNLPNFVDFTDEQ